MTKPLVHLDEASFLETRHGDKFGARFVRLGGLAGGKNLRTSLYEIAPGKTAFPHHAHHGLEEAIYVLEGEGTLRLGDDDAPVRAGSYAAFVAGGPAHQLINTGTSTLRYLCMSAGSGADVVTYPDSKKVAAFAGDWDTMTFSHRGLYWDKDHPDYYDGE